MLSETIINLALCNCKILFFFYHNFSINASTNTDKLKYDFVLHSKIPAEKASQVQESRCIYSLDYAVLMD